MIEFVEADVLKNKSDFKSAGSHAMVDFQRSEIRTDVTPKGFKHLVIEDCKNFSSEHEDSLYFTHPITEFATAQRLQSYSPRFDREPSVLDISVSSQAPEAVTIVEYLSEIFVAVVLIVSIFTIELISVFTEMPRRLFDISRRSRLRARNESVSNNACVPRFHYDQIVHRS